MSVSGLRSRSQLADRSDPAANPASSAAGTPRAPGSDRQTTGSDTTVAATVEFRHGPPGISSPHDQRIPDGGHLPLSGSDMELGHWVTGSMGNLGHLSRPGHRVIILTRCETRVFPVFHCKRFSHNYGTNIALPWTMQILLFGALYKYSYLLTYLVEYSSTR